MNLPPEIAAKLIENSPIKFFVKNASHEFLYCNKALMNTIASEGLDAIQRPLTDFDLFAIQYANKTHADEIRIMQGDTSYENGITEREVYLKSGRQALVHTHKFIHKSSEGKVLGIYGFSQELEDFTDHAGIGLVNTSDSGLLGGSWYIDLKGNSHQRPGTVKVSDQWRARFIPKGSVAETIKDWRALVYKADRPKIQSAFMDHLVGKSPHYCVEYRMRDLNGEYRNILAIGKKVTRPVSKHERSAIGIRGVHYDLTPLKRINTWYNYAIDHANIGIWDYDVTQRRQRINDHWATMLGYERNAFGEFLTHDEWESLIHPEDLGTVSGRFLAYVSGSQKSYDACYRMKTQSGEYRSIASRCWSIDEDDLGRPTRIVGVHYDINNLREENLRADWHFFVVTSLHDLATDVFTLRQHVAANDQSIPTTVRNSINRVLSSFEALRSIQFGEQRSAASWVSVQELFYTAANRYSDISGFRIYVNLPNLYVFVHKQEMVSFIKEIILNTLQRCVHGNTPAEGFLRIDGHSEADSLRVLFIPSSQALPTVSDSQAGLQISFRKGQGYQMCTKILKQSEVDFLDDLSVISFKSKNVRSQM